MKILVFSDSHGASDNIKKAMALHPDAEVVFFLGDGLSDIEPYLNLRPTCTWLFVRGNCDYTGSVLGFSAEKTASITLMNKKIVYTHGDLYGVKYGYDGVIRLAEERGAEIVLFGHTHVRTEKYIPTENGGVYIFNPGSIGGTYGSVSSYGVITLTDNGVLLSHGELD